MEDILFYATLNVIRLIWKEDFDSLKKQKYLEKLSEQDVKDILKEYGGDLSEIDEQTYRSCFRYIAVENKPLYITFLNIVIDNEISDLTLMCEIKLREEKVESVIIEDIHVL